MKLYDLVGLPMSLSGVMLGAMLSAADYYVSWTTASLLVAAAVFIHLYMASGSRWTLVLSIAASVAAAYFSYGTLFCLESLILLLFAYFVLRLFKGASYAGWIAEAVITCLVKGLVALFGAYFVCSHSFGSWVLLFPALSIGLLCVAADGTTDNYGKTLTNLLIYIGVALMVTYSGLRIFVPIHFLFLITLPAFIFITFRMYMSKEHNSGTYRPVLALCTFALALLAGVGFIGYLF